MSSRGSNHSVASSDTGKSSMPLGALSFAPGLIISHPRMAQGLLRSNTASGHGTALHVSGWQ